MPTLTGRSPYLAKDQAKSDKANKFIGRGSSRSSTEQYRKDWGELANCGLYTYSDVVFVSAEGDRSGRLKPDFIQLAYAVEANSTFITDNIDNRSRKYNIGEREVSLFLSSQGYKEIRGSGVWTR